MSEVMKKTDKLCLGCWCMPYDMGDNCPYGNTISCAFYRLKTAIKNLFKNIEQCIKK